MIFSAEDMLEAEEYYPFLFLVEAVECSPFFDDLRQWNVILFLLLVETVDLQLICILESS